MSLLTIEDALMCGLMLVTVYAQFFSLFAKVSLAAHIILYLIDLALFIFILKNAELKAFLLSLSSPLRNKAFLKICLIIFSILLFSYGTSRGYMHYDSDLYHAQSIRWIEECGVVKGLGNLHGRLAYNSSSFVLSAMYSFAFLSPTSLHACAGFMALTVFLCSLRFIHIFSDKKPSVTDFVRLAAMYYIFNIFDEMVSPASDYFAMLLFLYIVLRLCDLYKAYDADLWAVFTFLSVFLATIKFSAAGVLLICLLPIFSLIREKKVLRILEYSGIGIIIALPYFIRNYLISGWLLYPSTIIDIFSPEWKIPKFYADVDSSYIIAFGRGFSNMDASNYSLVEWFPHWFSTLGDTEKIFMLGSFASIPVFLCLFFLDRKKNPLYLTELSVILTFLMWLLSSPLIRYGQGIILCLPFMMFGHLFIFISCRLSGKLSISKWLNYLAVLFFALFVLYKGIAILSYCYKRSYEPYYLRQLDYGKYELQTYSVKGVTFYAPLYGDQVGYAPFPSSPQVNNIFTLLGDDIKDGFKSTHFPETY